jgi:hypothetical protein
VVIRDYDFDCHVFQLTLNDHRGRLLASFLTGFVSEPVQPYQFNFFETTDREAISGSCGPGTAPDGPTFVRKFHFGCTADCGHDQPPGMVVGPSQKE